jgi:hypothetical protein
MPIKMVNKDVLAKGVSLLAYSFPFFFGGPMLLFYSVQEENTLLKIVAGILMLAAMYLGTKGVMTIVEAFFGKRK